MCMNLLLCLWLLVSCHSEDMDFSAPASGYGKVELRTMSFDVDVTGVPLVPRTRLAAPSAEEKNRFIIHIFNDKKDKVQTYTYGEMPDVVELPVGMYTIEACSAAKPESGLNKPYYRGESTFEIKKDVITSLKTISCKLANVMVTALLNETLLPLAGEDLKVEMWFVENDKVSLSLEDIKKGTEYFLVAPAAAGNVLQVRISGHVDGEKVQKQQAFDSVDAGTWQQVTFTFQIIQEGTLDVEISVDGTVTSKDETVVVKPVEPGVDDFPGSGTEKPEQGEVAIIGKSFAGSPFNMDAVQTLQKSMSENVECIVNIAASKGIQQLKVKISSDNNEFNGIGVSLGEFDVADENLDAEKKELLTSLGLLQEGVAIKGQKDVDFAITNATKLLAGFAGTHTFTITVVDAAGKSLQKSLVIKVQ